MQKVLLNYDNPNFFCPITGVQILSENDANLSPACVFLECVIEGCITFQSNDPEIEKSYNYFHSSIIDGELDEVLDQYHEDPIYYFLNEVFEKKDHYVLFELTGFRKGCGPSRNKTYIVIDTSYEEALDR
jgi:hypothetical protein